MDSRRTYFSQFVGLRVDRRDVRVEKREPWANKSVKTAPSLMNIMVSAVGRRGRDGCTGEKKNRSW